MVPYSQARRKADMGMYDLPSRRCSRVFEMQTTGRARVHGIEGVEVTARESACGGRETVERRFVAQLTETHCRYLAAFRDDGEVRDYVTFLDGDAFLPNWGFGEDNIGNETNLAPKGRHPPRGQRRDERGVRFPAGYRGQVYRRHRRESL